MRRSRWPPIVVTWALLFAGLTNAHAHVHLCFDGQEAPAAMHVAEHGDHHVEHGVNDAEHDDIDVDLPNQALAKAFKHDLYAVVPHAVTRIRYDGTTALRAAPAAQAPPKRAPPYLRPPLRAPPR